VLAALSVITLMAWLQLLRMAGQMDMGESVAMAGMTVGIESWTLQYAWMMAVMWIVMMFAMMVPSAAPMVLLYAAVARKAAREGSTLAPSAVFMSGYLAAWSGFSLLATALQWLLDQAALLSPMLRLRSPAIGAMLLILTGFYQLSPWKETCLQHCRSPAQFLSSHWRQGPGGAFRMGVDHGLYCLGCCWVLMTLLFVGGVMNLWWIIGISLFVLAEKLMPWGERGGRLAGIATILCGAALFLGKLHSS
jgi:predicted metal-binding membrane protein